MQVLAASDPKGFVRVKVHGQRRVHHQVAAHHARTVGHLVHQQELRRLEPVGGDDVGLRRQRRPVALGVEVGDRADPAFGVPLQLVHDGPGPKPGPRLLRGFQILYARVLGPDRAVGIADVVADAGRTPGIGLREPDVRRVVPAIAALGPAHLEPLQRIRLGLRRKREGTRPRRIGMASVLAGIVGLVRAVDADLVFGLRVEWLQLVVVKGPVPPDPEGAAHLHLFGQKPRQATPVQCRDVPPAMRSVPGIQPTSASKSR